MPSIRSNRSGQRFASLDSGSSRRLRQIVRNDLEKRTCNATFKHFHRSCTHPYYLSQAGGFGGSNGPSWPLDAPIAKWAKNGDRSILSELDPSHSKCLSHFYELPLGQVGLVVGSGGNTPFWKEKGWLTLDSEQGNCRGESPDFVNTVDQMCESLEDRVGSVDCVFFEYLPYKELNPTNFAEAWKALKDGGCLVIETGGAVNCLAAKVSIPNLLTQLSEAQFAATPIHLEGGFRSLTGDRSRAQIRWVDLIVIARKEINCPLPPDSESQDAIDALLGLGLKTI